VLASSKFPAEQPEAVRKFGAATVRATRWVIANRDQAVGMVAKVDPLIDKKLERTRLDMAFEMNVLTPHVREHGIGAVVPGGSSVRSSRSRKP
jgi:NitT/TauT family transport system substrate-binding protein